MFEICCYSVTGIEDLDHLLKKRKTSSLEMESEWPGKKYDNDKKMAC